MAASRGFRGSTGARVALVATSWWCALWDKVGPGDVLVAASRGLGGTGPLNVLVVEAEVVAASLVALGLWTGQARSAAGPHVVHDMVLVAASSRSAVPTPRALNAIGGERCGAAGVGARALSGAGDLPCFGVAPARSLALGMGEVAACTVRAGTHNGEVAADTATGPRGVGVGVGSATARISIEYSILSTGDSKRKQSEHEKV